MRILNTRQESLLELLAEYDMYYQATDDFDDSEIEFRSSYTFTKFKILDDHIEFSSAKGDGKFNVKLDFKSYTEEKINDHEAIIKIVGKSGKEKEFYCKKLLIL